MNPPPLAFVDVETTGLDPRVNRITEVGVVTVDGSRTQEWSTVINPLTRRQERPVAPHEITDAMRDDAPRFKEIAADLARRLDGRLLIAHNARFDHGFLRAEFDRIGIDFAPKVLCSLMLSRRLYAELAKHDLDSLMATHALTIPIRHRALHDARLVWQFWQHVHRTLPRATVAQAIDELIERPLLHGHLDITWRATQGPLGARLQLALRKARPARAVHSWRFTPDAVPCISLVALSRESMAEGDPLYGTFDSPRKAKNAIRRLASTHRLCHSLLGLGADACAVCFLRAQVGRARCCEPGPPHLAHLTQAFSALRHLRVPVWPYRGPIAIRERRDAYIFDQWQYLGTARNSSEIHAVLDSQPSDFDVKVLRMLVKTLRRLPPNRIVPLTLGGGRAAASLSQENDQRDEAVLAPPAIERIAEMSSRSAAANWPAESSIDS